MAGSFLQVLSTHGTFPWRHGEGPAANTVGWRSFVPSLSAHPLPSAASKEGQGWHCQGRLTDLPLQ